MKGRYVVLISILSIIFLIDFTRYNIEHQKVENHITTEYMCNGKSDPCKKYWLLAYNCNPNCQYAISIANGGLSFLRCESFTNNIKKSFDPRKVWYTTILPWSFIIIVFILIGFWYKENEGFLNKVDKMFGI